jgi:hypothetical protein
MVTGHFLKARVSAETKERVQAVVEKDLVTESIWLRRVVLRALTEDGRNSDSAATGTCKKRGPFVDKVSVRLRAEDRLLLHERAAARGMASATYVSVLVRSHLRALTPLPKEELAALKRAVAELGAVGRNLNQIARAVHSGTKVGGLAREEFKAIMRICEALRDHTKNLIKGNGASWASGNGGS